MAPLPDSILSLLPRSLFSSSAPTIHTDPRALSPMTVHDIHRLSVRATPNWDPGAGAKPPDTINNKGFFALFALIGVGMVLASIWFFFIHPNGGFKFREGDWEDYKSTVLRRKGPDGKTLSNATKSTKLGGGSVVHGGSYGAPTSVGYTDETGSSAGFSEMREVEAGRGGAFGLRGGEARKENKDQKRPEHVTNNYKDPELREYRHEKPARVGGLNRVADGQYTDYSSTGVPSELGSNVSQQPLTKGKKKKTEADEKKEAKAKKERAKARMREAQAKEKAAVKAAKEAEKAEKAQAKKDRAEQKKQKKHRADTEATPSEYPATEYPPTEYPATEAPTEAGPSIPHPPAARRAPPSAAYSFTTGDDTATVYTAPYTATQAAPSEVAESSYYSDYRPNADPEAFSRASRKADRERRSNSQSPRKHRTSRPAVPPSDIFSHVPGEETGHKSYPCYIPGLSSAGSVGVSESVSQVGGPSSARRGRDVMDGYRRGTGAVRVVGRRDSLSDSD